MCIALLQRVHLWTNDVYPLQRQSSDVRLCKESRLSLFMLLKKYTKIKKKTLATAKWDA